MAPPHPSRPARRLAGLDVARAVAVVGMVMVHFWQAPPGGSVGAAEVLYSLSRGRASVLFVLLAAVGITLAAAGHRGRTGLSLLGRSLVLVPLGLGLQLLHDQVNVILQFYAVYLALAWAALGLGTRTLLTAAAGWMLAGPVAYLLAGQRRPQWFGDAAELGDPVGVVVRDVLLTGAYPVVTWGGPLLAGVWLGRHRLRSPAVRQRMVVVGSAVAAGAWALSRTLEAALGVRPRGSPWWDLVLDDSHSQMPLWLLGATGSAVAVLGACLSLAEVAPRLLSPLAALGRFALTAYVAHLLLVALLPDAVVRTDVRLAALTVVAFTAVTALVALLWLSRFGYGPLEAVARMPSRVLDRLVVTGGSASQPQHRSGDQEVDDQSGGVHQGGDERGAHHRGVHPEPTGEQRDQPTGGGGQGADRDQ